MDNRIKAGSKFYSLNESLPINSIISLSIIDGELKGGASHDQDKEILYVQMDGKTTLYRGVRDDVMGDILVSESIRDYQLNVLEGKYESEDFSEDLFIPYADDKLTE